MNLGVERLTFSYGERALFLDFTLAFPDQSITAILGPSGCGKTTLLKILAGLLAPLSGRVQVVPDHPVSFVFQEPRLLPWRTVLENVALPLVRWYGTAGARQRTSHYLELVGLGAEQNTYPDALSGGQRQRVSIARAFAFPAAAILMDEPFQALDLPLRIQLMDLTAALLQAEPRTVVLVTHDPREAIYLGDRVLVLSAAPVRVALDQELTLSRADRAYSSRMHAELEARLFAALSE